MEAPKGLQPGLRRALLPIERLRMRLLLLLPAHMLPGALRKGVKASLLLLLRWVRLLLQH